MERLLGAVPLLPVESQCLDLLQQNATTWPFGPLKNAMDFIPDSAIEALAGHKFQSAGYTWLDVPSLWFRGNRRNRWPFGWKRWTWEWWKEELSTCYIWVALWLKKFQGWNIWKFSIFFPPLSQKTTEQGGLVLFHFFFFQKKITGCKKWWGRIPSAPSH